MMGLSLKVGAALASLSFVAAGVAEGQYFDPSIQQNMQQLESSMQQQMQYNMQQQQMLQQQMEAHVAQTRQAAEAQLQEGIRNPSPEMIAKYQQYVHSTGGPLPFAQWYREVITEEAARRFNAAQGSGNYMSPALRAQIERGNAATASRNAANEAWNSNWAANQQQIQNNYDSYKQIQRQSDSNQAQYIQGPIYERQYYKNAETGQVQELGYTNDPGMYQNPQGDTYVSPQMGQYYQVGPNGERQEMQEYQPQYYGEE